MKTIKVYDGEFEIDEMTVRSEKVEEKLIEIEEMGFRGRVEE